MNDETFTTKPEKKPVKNPMGYYSWAAALAAVIGFAAVYVTLDRAGNGRPAMTPRPATQGVGSLSDAAKTEPALRVSRVNPLSTGAMATFVFKKAPEALPEISFVDLAGEDKRLKDWRGKVILLNLWATWCAPCRKEMPGLEKLEIELGSDNFEVIALSIDRKGAKAAKRFLDQIKVEELVTYNDPTGKSRTALRIIGLPTTLLIDRKGREIGRLVGPAEWDSADARRLIKAQLQSAP